MEFLVRQSINPIMVRSKETYSRTCSCICEHLHQNNIKLFLPFVFGLVFVYILVCLVCEHSASVQTVHVADGILPSLRPQGATAVLPRPAAPHGDRQVYTKWARQRGG